MAHAAASRAMLLLLFAAITSSPGPTMARDLSQVVQAKVKTGTSPLSDQCTAVAGQITTECRPSCQVCKESPASPDSSDWVPSKRRACVCCAPGRFPHETNAAACRLCRPGSVAPAAGSTGCTNCSEGFTTPITSRTTCSVCRPGRAGRSCQKCRPGTWSPGADTASVVCTTCPAGTHAMMAGSTTDKDCKQIPDSDWQNITITVTVNSTSSCNATVQQDMAGVIMQEVDARTAPQHTTTTTKKNVTCTSTSVRRAATPNAIGSIYQFAIRTFGLVGSFVDLQTQLQQILGFTYELGVIILVEPAVTLPAGDCTGDPGEEVFANAVWNCSVTKDGEWCRAVRCADGFLPSQGPLAAQCVGGKFVRRQGDCYSYTCSSRVPASRAPQAGASATASATHAPASLAQHGTRPCKSAFVIPAHRSTLQQRHVQIRTGVKTIRALVPARQTQMKRARTCSRPRPAMCVAATLATSGTTTPLHAKMLMGVQALRAAAAAPPTQIRFAQMCAPPRRVTRVVATPATLGTEAPPHA